MHIKPNHIISDETFTYNGDPFTLWGLVISDNDAFIKEFKSDKAPVWPSEFIPNNSAADKETRRIWGKNMLYTTKDQGVSGQRTVKLDQFKKDPEYFGLMTFGNIYDTFAKKKLGLEIWHSPGRARNIKQYPLEMIAAVCDIRCATLKEVGGTPHMIRTVGFDMDVLRAYAEGRYLNQSGEQFHINQGSNIAEYVGLLRRLNVPEGTVEPKVYDESPISVQE